jgi:predicted nucleic acid-binding protein
VNGVRSFYLDASALAKRYAPEAGSLLVDHLFAGAPASRFFVLNVGIAEVVWQLVRKKNSAHITAAVFSQAMLQVRVELLTSTSLNRAPVETDLVITGLPLIESHSINATDAIILRSALDLAASLRAVGDDLVFVASDLRLLRAAQAEGLVTFNPETQTQPDLDALLGP